ncbi:hypothetical protein ADIS_4407 [Lunatimonas lonarensis]|uniref:Uncharacterized protein n=1 Tax=Lunatimonas lonarensis TaxID=1232681 RepID=R7ZMA6_9BACT|nr:hypothetical protein ADIS_4407 [Lunatimonas lonarensis]
MQTSQKSLLSNISLDYLKNGKSFRTQELVRYRFGWLRQISVEYYEE